MKKILLMLCVALFIVASASAQAVKGGTMYVAAKTVELKSSTDFFASAKGTLAYGAAVTVLQIKGKWAEVRSTTGSSISGWTAVANLSAKRIVAGAGSGATANEVALAGKGFNQEIENTYKAGGTLNYADVDRTEAQRVSKQELKDFIVEGRLFLGAE
ncbi:MAG: hypothetical protein LBC52_03940 [Treponema sp.]|jgi:hypothetical protein|nr:hypothetical protein [Treponema sp.]